MAELSLAIVGVALAWKGILDFGEIIRKITDDDVSRREGLWLKLQVSQYRLKDWGQVWGINRADGRFHHFEPARKDLIATIVFRLKDSRYQALERLKTRYGLLEDKQDQNVTAPKDGFTRLLARIKSAPQTIKDKTVWLARDKEKISDLVNETIELHELLQYLTYGSESFIIRSVPGVRSAPSLTEGLRDLDQNGRESAVVFHRSLAASSGSPSLQVDEQTLASYSTKTIASTRQAGHLQQQIDHAFDFYGDLRIPEIIAEWWNDSRSRLLILETPDIADDHTSTFTCSLVFYLVSCHRLVYTFGENSEGPDAQFFDMLKTFILSMVSLQGTQSQPARPLPFGVSEIGDMRMDESNVQQLAEVFKDLILDLSPNPGMRFLIIIDGLNIYDGQETGSYMRNQRSFYRNLQEFCNRAEDGRDVVVKVLIGCKGHAMTLYNCVNPESVVDLTSVLAGSTRLVQDLALKMDQPNVTGDPVSC
jgi:hypothetical protein